MHTVCIFRNILCFALVSYRAKSEQDLRQMTPEMYRRHPLHRHLKQARTAEGVSRQISHPLKAICVVLITSMHPLLDEAVGNVTDVIELILAVILKHLSPRL